MRDLTGQTFGKLTILGLHEKKNRHYYWEAQCSCGNISYPRTDSLIRTKNPIQSCGCLNPNSYKHGGQPKELYESWHGMKKRCSGKLSTRKWYRVNNITVCDEWKEYIPFRDWALAHGYQKGLSIERIDNLKGYHPDNCEWIELKYQTRNTNNTVLDEDTVAAIKTSLKYGQNTATLAKQLNINRKTLNNIKYQTAWKDVPCLPV